MKNTLNIKERKPNISIVIFLVWSQILKTFCELIAQSFIEIFKRKKTLQIYPSKVLINYNTKAQIH
jgi:hypothetical protein